jgi:hypothetical protein
MPVKNNPLAPFIKGDFLKSPLIKGDSGGCLVCYDTNFEIPEHELNAFGGLLLYTLHCIVITPRTSDLWHIPFIIFLVEFSHP